MSSFGNAVFGGGSMNWNEAKKAQDFAATQAAAMQAEEEKKAALLKAEKDREFALAQSKVQQDIQDADVRNSEMVAQGEYGRSRQRHGDRVSMIDRANGPAMAMAGAVGELFGQPSGYSMSRSSGSSFSNALRGSLLG